MSFAFTFIDVSPTDLSRGYKACRQVAKQNYPNWTWTLFNLPGDVRRGMDSLIFLMHQGLEVIGDRQDDSLAMERAEELRDKLNDAMCERFVSAEWATVYKTMTDFRVPKQFLFDFTAGVDHVVRFGQPRSYDELLVRASLLGGSPLAAAVKIMGVERDDYAVPAIRCGQALLISRWLSEVRRDALQNTVWLARDDFQQTECNVDTLRSTEFSKPVTHLARLYAHRIEHLFHESKDLMRAMDFDCSRAVRGLVGAAWKSVLKIRRTPEVLFQPDGPISPSERFALKAKYVLGIEGEMPFSNSPHDHHH